MTDLSAKAGSDEMQSVVRAARDAVTDDMVARLADTTSQAMDLLDRVNRSGIADALPAVAELARTGDLQRLVHYARVLGAAEDAVTDDMIGRFAMLAGEATMVVDRLNRSGVTKLIHVLDQLNNSGALDRIAATLPEMVESLDRVGPLLGCFNEAAAEVRGKPAPAGGLLPLLALLREPENQRSLQFLMALGRRMCAAPVK